MKKQKISRQEKGITLIALIITIIVLLILAGVTILSIQGDGILQNAKNATDVYNQKQLEEQKILDEYANQIDGIAYPNKIKNPFDPDGWDIAYTCTNEIWSNEPLTKGTAIGDGVDIVAKFYKQDNIVTPPTLNFNGATLQFNPGNAYKLVIEGNGKMGPMMQMSVDGNIEGAFGWQVQPVTLLSGGGTATSETSTISYVVEAIICDGITNIVDCAFSGVTALEKVTMSNSVSQIAVAAFAFCANLTSVSIPNGVEIIDGSAFEACSKLTTVTIPNSITTIGRFAFGNCVSLSSIYIEKTTNGLTVSESAFHGLPSGSKIYVKNDGIKNALEGTYKPENTTISIY